MPTVLTWRPVRSERSHTIFTPSASGSYQAAIGNDSKRFRNSTKSRLAWPAL
jgi:hypothetical protein